MRQTLLFAPESWMSAEVCENLPGISSALTEIRRKMDVAIFKWPCTAGGVQAGPAWQEVARAMATSIEEEAAKHGLPVTLIAMPDAAPLVEGLRKAMVKVLERRPAYQCVHCGFTPTLLFWQCPSCKQWTTVAPLDEFAAAAPK